MAINVDPEMALTDTMGDEGMHDEWHIAQLNIAKALHLLDDQRMSRFVEQLDEINALGENSPGFVWRLQSETGNATDIQVGDDPSLIVNLTVWRTVEALFAFAYKSAHRLVLADRKRWFKRSNEPHQVLWWVPAGHIPSLDEGMQKLSRLRKTGPSAQAFSFKSKFPPPGESELPVESNPEPVCLSTRELNSN